MKIPSKIFITMNDSVTLSSKDSLKDSQKKSNAFFANEAKSFETRCTKLDFANARIALGSQKRNISKSIHLRRGSVYQRNTKWLQKFKNQVMTHRHTYPSTSMRIKAQWTSQNGRQFSRISYTRSVCQPRRERISRMYNAVKGRQLSLKKDKTQWPRWPSPSCAICKLKMTI